MATNGAVARHGLFGWFVVEVVACAQTRNRPPEPCSSRARNGAIHRHLVDSEPSAAARTHQGPYQLPPAVGRSWLDDIRPDCGESHPILKLSLDTVSRAVHSPHSPYNILGAMGDVTHTHTAHTISRNLDFFRISAFSATCTETCPKYRLSLIHI